jgi:hypothetical protein
MRIFLMLPLFGILASCASGPPSAATLKYQAREKSKLETALAGKVAGKPQSCIRSRDVSGPESFGDNILVFRVSRKLSYVNETRGSCKEIGNGRALVTRSFNGDLCRGDIATSADLTAGFETGSCSLGDFVPYRGG